MEPFFHNLPIEAQEIPFPEHFTYPFNYQPHPLCLLASQEVKAYLQSFQPWLQESGGKMFGVLVVCTPNRQLGFLAAYSGNLSGKNNHPYFVPPVYDLLNPQGYFVQEEKQISFINHQIESLDNAKDIETIQHLKEERKQRSHLLQRWLFEQYHFLNYKGEKQHLLQIFHDNVPPGGAGECCAPKLMQTAYSHGWKPLCMAEFWMGPSPQDELRQEGIFYPACRSKCKPILEFMLDGLDTDPNPLIEINRRMAEQLQTVYEDDAICVVNKPSGMLSVPGKDDLPSVYSVMQERNPSWEGPIIVHRLDMDTSGLMVLAKNEVAYKNLQQQFISHKIQKEYYALLDVSRRVSPIPAEGIIDLPICPNPYDRPRQIVSYEYGKRSITHYKIIGYTTEGHAIVLFTPETGRTHQLRVHAAHPQGLNSPIVGDNLYGTPQGRLRLHAQRLIFQHPTTSQIINMSCNPTDF